MDKGGGRRGGGGRRVKGAGDDPPSAKGMVVKSENINGGKGAGVTLAVARCGMKAKGCRARVRGGARLIKQYHSVGARATHKPNNRDRVGVPILIVTALLCMRKFRCDPYMYL